MTAGTELESHFAAGGEEPAAADENKPVVSKSPGQLARARFLKDKPEFDVP